MICTGMIVGLSTMTKTPSNLMTFAYGTAGLSRTISRGSTSLDRSVIMRSSGAKSAEAGWSDGDSLSGSGPHLGPILSGMAVVAAGTAVAFSSSASADAAPLVTQFARQHPEQGPLLGQFFSPLTEGFGRQDEDRSAGLFFMNNRLLPIRQKLSHMNDAPELVAQAGIPLAAWALASKAAESEQSK